MPKLSVIVPVFNAEKTLRRCVDSVLSQKMADFEVILVDDGSKDSSAAICDVYAQEDPRVKVLRQENKGVSTARNVGLDSAAGDWICFVDSDDYVSEDYFPEEFDDSKDLYVLNWMNFGGNTGQEEFFKSGPVKGERVAEFFGKNMFKLALEAPWAKFYKRQIIEKNNLRFDSRIKLGEDCVFNQRYYNYVDSIMVPAEGHYFYYCIGDYYQNYGKYHLSVEDAVLFLEELFSAYKATRYKSPILLDLEKQGRFERLSLMGLSRKDWLKWKYSKVIFEINCETGKYVGFMGLVKKLLFPIISPVMHTLLDI